MKSKHKHKYQRKPVRYLSDRRAFNEFVRYNRKIYEMIKAFREQVKVLVCTAPF